MIKSHVDQYKRQPTVEVLRIGLEDNRGLSEYDRNSISETLEALEENPCDDVQWLVDATEKYCVEQSVFNALSISLLIQENDRKAPDSRDTRLPPLAIIPDLMRRALDVCFDTSVGHEYFADFDGRYESYITKANKIPFQLPILNKITQGGIELRTLNLILGGSNVGKSMALCSLAVEYLLQGIDVLYISMEMSEEAVAKRIDANILDVSMDSFDLFTKSTYTSKIKNAEKSTQGKLFIKQYPTAGASVSNFNALMSELKQKKNFKPTVVIIDYLGICASNRVSNSENTYVHVKAIAEEVRGFAIEHNVGVWSAAQTTRNAWDASDMGMGDIAESAGLVHTSDLILAVMETDESIAMGQQRVKQIKSRYADKSEDTSFMINVNKSKQRWSDEGESLKQYTTAPIQESSSPFNMKSRKKADDESKKENSKKVNW